VRETQSRERDSRNRGNHIKTRPTAIKERQGWAASRNRKSAVGLGITIRQSGLQRNGGELYCKILMLTEGESSRLGAGPSPLD